MFYTSSAASDLIIYQECPAFSIRILWFYIRMLAAEQTFEFQYIRLGITYTVVTNCLLYSNEQYTSITAIQANT